jgi:energy-coupling factor transport system ATP-binding protein
VVVSEHRLEALLGQADALALVEAGRVEGPAPVAELRGRLPELPAARPPPSASGPVAWSLVGVSAGHGRTPILEDVELCGRQGEVVVLRGPNGSGKTTLLRVIAGLLPPMAGRVEREPGRVAYLPQNPQDVLHLPSVRDELELTIRRTGGRDDADRILARLGLAGLAGRYPRDLSTGERQRAAIAAIVAGGPALALLDEPTRGMDVPARAALVDLVSGLREEGAAVVVATHDAHLTAAVADRVVELGAGRAVQGRGER